MIKRPQKRRRLSTTSSTTSTTETIYVGTRSPSTLDALPSHLNTTNASCISCKRSFPMASPSENKQGYIIVCPRYAFELLRLIIELTSLLCFLTKVPVSDLFNMFSNLHSVPSFYAFYTTTELFSKSAWNAFTYL